MSEKGTFPVKLVWKTSFHSFVSLRGWWQLVDFPFPFFSTDEKCPASRCFIKWHAVEGMWSHTKQIREYKEDPPVLWSCGALACSQHEKHTNLKDDFEFMGREEEGSSSSNGPYSVHVSLCPVFMVQIYVCISFIRQHRSRGRGQ